MKINYNRTQLQINGHIVETPWPIKEAFELDDKVIVLMDIFAHLKGPIENITIQQIRESPKGRNLFCYSSDGKLLWKAEFPKGNDKEDYYYRISSRLPLVVNSFSSYRCEIDPATGKIIRKDFFK